MKIVIALFQVVFTRSVFLTLREGLGRGATHATGLGAVARAVRINLVLCDAVFHQ